MCQEDRNAEERAIRSQNPEPISCCSKPGRRNRFSRFGIAVFFVMVGLLWLAATTGWFPGEYVGPIVLTVFGLWMFAHSAFCGIAMTVMGALWLAETAGQFQHGYFWPLTIILMGILMFAADLIRRSKAA